MRERGGGAGGQVKVKPRRFWKLPLRASAPAPEVLCCFVRNLRWLFTYTYLTTIMLSVMVISLLCLLTIKNIVVVRRFLLLSYY